MSFPRLTSRLHSSLFITNVATKGQRFGLGSMSYTSGSSKTQTACQGMVKPQAAVEAKVTEQQKTSQQNSDAKIEGLDRQHHGNVAGIRLKLYKLNGEIRGLHENPPSVRGRLFPHAAGPADHSGQKRYRQKAPALNSVPTSHRPNREHYPDRAHNSNNPPTLPPPWSSSHAKSSSKPGPRFPVAVEWTYERHLRHALDGRCWYQEGCLFCVLPDWVGRDLSDTVKRYR